MKLLLTLLIALLPIVTRATGPICVLYLGKKGTQAPGHCALLMQELGRDAIWFDDTSDQHAVTREWMKKFDAIVLDAPGEEFKELGAQDEERLVKPEYGLDEKSWQAADFIQSIREKLLTAAGGVRRAEWEGFLADRQPEKREPDQNVANYEKRPEAITFQEPMRVQGSAVGSALDGIATRATPEYIRDSLLEPNKVLAKGFEHIGTSPMPPLGPILKPRRSRT